MTSRCLQRTELYQFNHEQDMGGDYGFGLREYSRRLWLFVCKLANAIDLTTVFLKMFVGSGVV